MNSGITFLKASEFKPNKSGKYTIASMKIMKIKDFDNNEITHDKMTITLKEIGKISTVLKEIRTLYRVHAKGYVKGFVKEKYNGTIKEIICNDKLIDSEILVNITKKDINLFKKFYKIDNDGVTSLNDNYDLKIFITINKVNSYVNTGIKNNNFNLELAVKIKYLLEIVDYLKIEEFSIYHIIDSLLFIKSNKGVVFISGMLWNYV